MNHTEIKPETKTRTRPESTMTSTTALGYAVLASAITCAVLWTYNAIAADPTSAPAPALLMMLGMSCWLGGALAMLILNHPTDTRGE